MADIEPNGRPAPTAFLSGRVVDAAGVPVPLAELRVCEEGAREFSGLRVLTFDRADDQGRFRIEISPGPCVILGAAPCVGLALPSDAAQHFAAFATRASPGPGESVGDLVVRLPYATADLGRVSGVLRDGEGRPVEGVAVTLDGVSLSGSAWRTKRTDSGGRFEFRRILPGTRKLGILGTRRFLCQRRSVDLPPGGDVEVAIAAVPRPREGSVTMRFRCEEESGGGVPGVAIQLDVEGDFQEVFVTGPDGEVVATGLPDELPEVHGSASAFHESRWAEGASWQHPFTPWKDRVVLRLRPPEEASLRAGTPSIRSRTMGAGSRSPDAPVSGRVLDASGVPVEGADVAWIPAKHHVPGKRDDLRTHRIGRTDSEGRFSARGLPPGPAVFVADYHGAFWMKRGEEAPTPARADLEEGVETSGLEIRLPFALADLAVVEFRVVDDADRPLEGVTVITEGRVEQVSPRRGGETDSEGRIAMRVLPGRREASAWATESHQGASALVEVRPGGRHDVTLRTPAWTRRRSVSLVVRVVDEAGAPVPGAEVHLSNMAGRVGEGRAAAGGECLFPSLHDEVRQQELHVSAFADGLCIGTPGATVRDWPEGRPARAVVVLHHPVKIRVRITEKGTGNFVPGCRLETRCAWSCAWDEYSEWEHERGCVKEVLPGKVALRAHAPGYRTAERKIVVARGEDPGVVDLELKPARGRLFGWL